MDYNNGKIYVIRNHCNDMVYVGSTTQSLSKRFSKHKCNCKSLTFPLYNAMNELDIMNFYIELVEEYPCDNREQLCAKEGHYIREFDSYNNGYNGQIEGRSRKEYRKQYREENKDKIKQYREKYSEVNKDKIKKQATQYYQEHKEKIGNYSKNYYEINKIKKKEKIECQCGSIVRKDTIKRHNKTKKHLKYIEKGEDEFEGF